MPKTKCPEQPVPDPSEFVDRFCKEHDLLPADAIGTSQLEKECILQAEKARQMYKDHRDGEIERQIKEEEPTSERSRSPGPSKRPKTIVADDSGLTPAQKYARRLFNNRKSAAASRVYHEVHKRALTTKLQRCSCDQPSASSSEIRVKQLQAENTELRNQIERLNYYNKRHVAERTRDNVKNKIRRVSTPTNIGIGRICAPFATSRAPAKQPQSTPASQEFVITHNARNQNQVASVGVFLNDTLNSQHHPMARTDSPSQEECQPIQAANNALVMQKWSNSLALSPVANVGDGKEFSTGLSYSQGLDAYEKSFLGRGQSLPMPHGIPLQSLGGSQLGSQPSQDLSSFRGATSPEENPIQDADFFLTSPQGDSKSDRN